MFILFYVRHYAVLSKIAFSTPKFPFQLIILALAALKLLCKAYAAVCFFFLIRKLTLK